MVTTRKDLNLYIYDCSEDYYVIVWHDVESVKFASPKALAVEDIMIKQFIEQFGFKPLANIQANATEVEISSSKSKCFNTIILLKLPYLVK